MFGDFTKVNFQSVVKLHINALEWATSLVEEVELSSFPFLYETSGFAAATWHTSRFATARRQRSEPGRSPQWHSGW